MHGALPGRASRLFDRRLPLPVRTPPVLIALVGRSALHRFGRASLRGSSGERLLPRQIAAVVRLRDPVKTIHQLAHAQLGKVENRDPVMLREADRHPGATLDPSVLGPAHHRVHRLPHVHAQENRYVACV